MTKQIEIAKVNLTKLKKELQNAGPRRKTEIENQIENLEDHIEEMEWLLNR